MCSRCDDFDGTQLASCNALNGLLIQGHTWEQIYQNDFASADCAEFELSWELFMLDQLSPA